MNIKVFLIAIAFTASLFFTSCKESDETISKPVITIHEFGEIRDDKLRPDTATVGGDLHIDIEVVAEGKIDKIRVIIHPEGSHAADSHEEWAQDTTYTEFSGLKNVDFHKHIKVDSTAETGAYHFDFIVTDMESQESRAGADLQIVEK